MSKDDEDADNALAELAKGSAETVKAAYLDLLQRPFRATSGLISFPLEMVLSGLEKLRPGGKTAELSPPPLHVAGPTMIGLTLAQDAEELRSMFIRLLATSMEEVEKAHPSFARVIQEMSPIEARLLRLLRDRGFGVRGTVVQNRATEPDAVIALGSTLACGLAENRYELVGAAEDNLTRLGLIQTRPEGVFTKGGQDRAKLVHDLKVLVITQVLEAKAIGTDESGFEEALRDPMFLGRVGCNLTIEFQELTDFGQAFADACIPGEEWTW